MQDDGHNVAEWTAESDLNQLENIIALHCKQKGMPFGWSWPQDLAPVLPGIALSKALILRMVDDYIHPLVPALMLECLKSRFRQARQKLEVLTEENPSAQRLHNVARVHPAMPR